MKRTLLKRHKRATLAERMTARTIGRGKDATEAIQVRLVRRERVGVAGHRIDPQLPILVRASHAHAARPVVKRRLVEDECIVRDVSEKRGPRLERLKRSLGFHFRYPWFGDRESATAPFVVSYETDEATCFVRYMTGRAEAVHASADSASVSRPLPTGRTGPGRVGAPLPTSGSAPVPRPESRPEGPVWRPLRPRLLFRPAGRPVRGGEAARLSCRRAAGRSGASNTPRKKLQGRGGRSLGKVPPYAADGLKLSQIRPFRSPQGACEPLNARPRLAAFAGVPA